MPLIYPIKVEYQDGLVKSLVSPHLKVNFIKLYSDVNSDSSLMLERMEINSLQIIVEDYIKWVQDNNYILRLPSQLDFDFLQQQNDQWINIQINVPIKRGLFEKSSEVVAVSLYLVNFILGIFIDVLAARLNKVSYTTLILPILANFILGGIFYKYSGASSNIIELGKKIDNFLSCKINSPRESECEKEYNICSSFNLSKFILCSLSLSNVIFQTLGYWQGMVSMGKQFKTLNSHDPFITPKSIFVLADITAIVYLIYEGILSTSFILKAAKPLKTIIDKLYDSCLKKLYIVYRMGTYEIFNGEEELLPDELHSQSSNFEMSHSGVKDEVKQNVNVFFITDVKYRNKLLNDCKLVHEAIKIGGASLLNKIINLGENTVFVDIIIMLNEQYGTEFVLKTLSNIPIITTNSLFRDFITIFTAIDSMQCVEIESIGREQIGNYFIMDSKGKVFIKNVANSFNKKTLDTILELGWDWDISEQIVSEAEAQSVNRVIVTLLGKELLVAGVTDTLENIISQDELSKLQIVPNGIFNIWSNKAYIKIVEYINNLAKNLDDLLNAGKSGSQVAVTLALLEEWLGFAASGQRFIGGGRPPYYNPDDKDDWAYGYGGGSSDGNNNISEGNFDNQNGFTGLILPSYNGADYNITDYQM